MWEGAIFSRTLHHSCRCTQRRLEGLGWASRGSAAEAMQGSEQDRIVVWVMMAAVDVERSRPLEVFFECGRRSTIKSQSSSFLPLPGSPLSVHKYALSGAWRPGKQTLKLGSWSRLLEECPRTNT